MTNRRCTANIESLQLTHPLDCLCGERLDKFGMIDDPSLYDQPVGEFFQWPNSKMIVKIVHIDPPYFHCETQKGTGYKVIQLCGMNSYDKKLPEPWTAKEWKETHGKETDKREAEGKSGRKKGSKVTYGDV